VNLSPLVSGVCLYVQFCLSLGMVFVRSIHTTTSSVFLHNIWCLYNNSSLISSQTLIEENEFWARVSFVGAPFLHPLIIYITVFEQAIV